MSLRHLSLGETYNPFGQDRENPFPLYARLRREEPIAFSPVLNAYLVTRLDDVQAMLSQPDLFSSRDALSPLTPLSSEALAELAKGYPTVPSFINSDGSNHKRFSTPLKQAFTPSRVLALEPIIREQIDQLLTAMLKEERADLISQLAHPLALEVICAFLGIPATNSKKLQPLCDDATALLLTSLPEDKQLACAKSVVKLQNYLMQLIKERRATPQADLITDLISTVVPDQEPLSDAELVWTLTEMIVTIRENTTNLIGNGLVLLLEMPERWRLLCEHPDYLPLTIEEILRYRGPIQGFMRTTTQPITRKGVAMPVGTRLFLLYSSANRDELQFSLSEHFQIQRRPNHHIAFGVGTHADVSAPLVRLQARLVFEALIQKLPGLHLSPDQQLTHNADLINSGYKSIEVAW